MELLSRPEFDELLKKFRISKRIARDLRYVPEEISYPEQRDFLAVMTKAGNEGVLLFQDKLIPISLQKRAANSRGRVEAVICDICASWQRGTNSATLTFKKSATTTVSYLVCADLDCSLHVRDLTDVSQLSRTQLREHITPEERTQRLRMKLTQILQPFFDR